jgi:predicted XRE-type DNA-binding protein
MTASTQGHLRFAKLCNLLHNPPMRFAHPPDGDDLAMRAALTGALEAWLAASGLTQTAAANKLGTTQARVSEIKHGKTAQFSLDLLVRLAARAGLHPRLTLDDPAP